MTDGLWVMVLAATTIAAGISLGLAERNERIAARYADDDRTKIIGEVECRKFHGDAKLEQVRKTRDFIDRPVLDMVFSCRDELSYVIKRVPYYEPTN